MKRLLCAALVSVSSGAASLEIKHDDLVGMWAYVSTYNEFTDGSKKAYFGERPIGRFSIMRSGHYSHIIACDPQSRKKKQCVLESLTHFGTYQVNLKEGSFTGFVEWAMLVRADGTISTELIGKQQLRVVTRLTGDELHYTNHESVAGADADVVAVLRRIP